MLCLSCSAGLAADPVPADFGRWSQAGLTEMLVSASRLATPGERIVEISGHFIDTPYAANTLVGGPQQAERLVINLAGFDCFTFLDVVEALRRSADVAAFPGHLQAVRYRDGTVDYHKRRHFFSDWVAEPAARVVDVTAVVGYGKAVKVTKQLNRKTDGNLWLPGIAVVARDIFHIPTAAIDTQILSALQPGDYIGIYSEQAGLDVSHTGLLVKTGESLLLRHAASRSGVARVVDEDLLAYLSGKPGLVVYRVKP